MLEDPHPTVRATAIHGVCRITGIFWELIPAHIIKMFVTKLVGCGYNIPSELVLVSYWFSLISTQHLQGVHMLHVSGYGTCCPGGGGGGIPYKNDGDARRTF